MTPQNKDTLFLATAGAGVLYAAYSAWRRRPAYGLRGKTVLITGGSRGLGFLLAREFAREGARPRGPSPRFPRRFTPGPADVTPRR